MAGYKATARTRLKYNGDSYAPGDEVVFENKKEAEAYGDAIEGGEALAPTQAIGAPTGGVVQTPAPAARGARKPAAADNAGTGNEGDEDVFEGVAFASPQAKAKAEELELTGESFKHQRKSSDNGFTVDDVERIASKPAE